MSRALITMFALIMACATSALIGYIIAVIRHDRQLRQAMEITLQESRQAAEEFEDEEERSIALTIIELVEDEFKNVRFLMGQRI